MSRIVKSIQYDLIDIFNDTSRCHHVQPLITNLYMCKETNFSNSVNLVNLVNRNSDKWSLHRERNEDFTCI